MFSLACSDTDPCLDEDPCLDATCHNYPNAHCKTFCCEATFYMNGKQVTCGKGFLFDNWLNVIFYRKLIYNE